MTAMSVSCSLPRLQTSFHLENEAFVSLRKLVSAAPPRVRLREGVRTSSFVRCAVSSTALPDGKRAEKQDPVVEKIKLVCPICQHPVVSTASQGLRLSRVKGDFKCQRCRKTYASKGGIIDLTIPSKGTIAPVGSSLFQNPLMAYVYERGYRDVFARAGFPGFDEEAQRAQDILKAARGDTVMDLSCGPGGFTRRFVSSGKFDTVIAVDFSEAMLEQARDFIENDKSVDSDKVVLVRADAGRLPFETSSMAGVHAGAAIHCWPNVQTSVAEISRVLRPGGIFVASTFLFPIPGGLEEPFKALRETINLLQLQMRWFEEDDLRRYMDSCGFTNYQSYVRERRFLRDHVVCLLYMYEGNKLGARDTCRPYLVESHEISQTLHCPLGEKYIQYALPELHLSAK